MGTQAPGKNSPALHHFEGAGYEIHFQDGPIQEFGINGTTNEALIELLIDRITSLQEMQDRKFACKENACAITHLEEALHWLQARTAKRLARGVEGTSVP